MRSAAWWKKRKEAELRSRAGHLPRSLFSEREATTWGALRCGHIGKSGATALPRLFKPSPAISEREAGIGKHDGRCVAHARERSGATALCGTFAPIPDFGASDGVWDDMGSPASGLNGRCGATALRGSFTQTRRPGASGVWNDMKSTAYERNGKRRSNGLTRVVYPNPRSWSEKRGLGRHGENALWTQWKNRSYGLLHRLAISEREAGSGTTVWWTKKPEQQPGEGHLFRSPVSE